MPKVAAARFISLLLGALSVWPSVAAAQDRPAKHVLLVYSHEREMSSYTGLDRALKSELEAGSPNPLVFYTEYLDLLRFSEDRHRQKLVDYLAVKFSGRPMDLVVVVSSLAFDFLDERGRQIFPHTPIVFTSVNATRLAKRSLGPNITGVAVIRDYTVTLDVILRLQPDTVSVVIPVGSSKAEKGWTEEARVSLKPYERRVAITYLDGLRMDEILARLKHLPPRTAVLFSPLFYTDAAGHYFLPEESLDLMSRAANAPIYGTNDTFLGLGIVGGALYDMDIVGAAGGRVALRILAGASPASVPVETISPNRNAFDARQLRRWNISETRLPPGSVVEFREPSVWRLYLPYILGCVALFLVLLALVVTLAAQTRKLQRSESLLRDLSGRLIHAQDEERKRIACELHDDFGQRISLLKIELELLAQEERPITRPGGAPRLRDVISRTDEFASDLQHLSHTLHSSRLQYVGLQSALKELCSDVAHRQDVVVELRAEPLAAPVQPEVALCLYRIAQEGLHNAAKHSGARQIMVLLSDDKRVVRMRIVDSGKGFDVTKASGGLGLPSMRARLRMLGGELLLHSAPGNGTALIAQVPLKALNVPVHGAFADTRSA